MGAVTCFDNPFEPTSHTVFAVHGRPTIRRFMRARLKRQTVMVRRDGRRVREFRTATVCAVNGRWVKRSEWSRITIGEKDVVTFVSRLSGGGGGGGGGSNPLMIVLAIAVAVAVPVVGQLIGAELVSAGLIASTTFANAIGGVIVGLVGYGLMSLFVQPPPPPTAADSGAFGGAANAAQTSPTYNLSAQGNRARLGQPIPEFMGRFRSFPDFAHTAYQSFDGNDQYLRYLLAVTMGEIDVEKTQIGDTPVGNFDEIDYEVVPPGGTVPTALVDPMMLVSGDLAETELPGSEASSPYKGPFIVNPAETTVEAIEIDYAAPQGLYYINDDSSLASRGFTFVAELQEIDDDGEPVGTWSVLDTVTESEAKREALRWTKRYTVDAARYQVRLKRTDAKDTSTRAGSVLEWIGLRGVQPGTRTFPGVTMLAMKLKATGNLNGQSSRQVNVIGTRKLPTWDAEAGAMGTELVATRNPCDAAAYICLNANGAGLSEDQVDLAGIYAFYDEYAANGWTFDGVFDTSTTNWEALGRVARCVIGQQIVQGPYVRIVRDLPVAAPAMVFTPRNILHDDLELSYKFPDERTADAVEIGFTNHRTFMPDFVTCAMEGSARERVPTVSVFGLTNRQQSRAVGFNIIRANLLRRRLIKLPVEMEHMMLLYGSAISVTHDVPAWGQAAEAVDYDAGSRTLTVDQPLVFGEGTHYAALRQKNGLQAGPFAATAVEGDPYRIVLGAGALPDLSLGGDAERTIVQFGPGDTYHRLLKVIGVTPRSEYTGEITAIVDDERMYDAIPAEA